MLGPAGGAPPGAALRKLDMVAACAEVARPFDLSWQDSESRRWLWRGCLWHEVVDSEVRAGRDTGCWRGLDVHCQHCQPVSRGGEPQRVVPLKTSRCSTNPNPYQRRGADHHRRLNHSKRRSLCSLSKFIRTNHPNSPPILQLKLQKYTFPATAPTSLSTLQFTPNSRHAPTTSLANKHHEDMAFVNITSQTMNRPNPAKR